MAKYTLSIISLIFIIQLKASRLLQQATCTSTLCIMGTQCYDTSNGPICCDPNICVKGRCGGNGLLECESGYECVAGDCPKGMTDCPGNCVNPDAKPQIGLIGDSCAGCQKLLCACSLCPGGEGAYGCCGGCTYKDDGNGNIICGAEPIISESNCPPVIPVEGATCGKQGIDCGGILSPQYTCSDGNCYGNCNTCTYQQNKSGNLECLAAIIAKEDVCPSLPSPCDAFENCASYTPDGCNTCGCPADGSVSFCTLIACSPELITKPECRYCLDGYTLNPITKQCEKTLTCANRLCPVGETCYETAKGPECCDANICQNGICGTRGGIECISGYECVEDPLKLCDPITTADCPGVCVDIDAKSTVTLTVGCDIDYCNNYFDGCNDCSCNDPRSPTCTERACKQLLEPYCTGCLPGYILNPNTNKCQGCICPAVYEPVCCNGKTYSHSCVAACQQATGPCNDGPCASSTTLEPCICPMVYDPVWCNGKKYSNSCFAACHCASSTTTLVPNINKCCDPNDKPGFNGNPICFEGAACCPDGTWSCSIGDGHTFPCGKTLLDTNINEMGKECCNGFANCKNYYDGCNDCICGENGLDACTFRWCLIHGEPKCNECEFGYRINDENGQCVMKKNCDYNGDCDEINGFKCRFDPMCRGQRNSNPLCTNASKVCFDYESRNCQSDLDCDVTNGFKCYGVNAQGNGVCGKYQ
eukprot:399483_1